MPQSNLSTELVNDSCTFSETFREPRCWNTFAHRRLRKGTTRSHNTKNAKELRSWGGSGHIAGHGSEPCAPRHPQPHWGGGTAGTEREREKMEEKDKNIYKWQRYGRCMESHRWCRSRRFPPRRRRPGLPDPPAAPGPPGEEGRAPPLPHGPEPQVHGQDGSSGQPPARLPGAHPGRCLPGAGEPRREGRGTRRTRTSRRRTGTPRPQGAGPPCGRPAPTGTKGKQPRSRPRPRTAPGPSRPTSRTHLGAAAAVERAAATRARGLPPSRSLFPSLFPCPPSRLRLSPLPERRRRRLGPAPPPRDPATWPPPCPGPAPPPPPARPRREPGWAPPGAGMGPAGSGAGPQARPAGPGRATATAGTRRSAAWEQLVWGGKNPCAPLSPHRPLKPQ